jgi:predicted nuclease with TOPRIM domain
MTSIVSELEALKDAIEEAGESELRELAKELCDKAEEMETDNSKMEDEIEKLKDELEEKAKYDELDYQSLQLKHPRLFTGDLSRLTHADRRDLFEEIYNFEGGSDSLTRIEHAIS